MSTVSLTNLTKRYRGESKPAVQQVNLDVADGEFMVLLGPSGCGKSTTLRMIAGLEAISEGTLLIDGNVMNGVPAKDRDIAMVFQSYALYPHMTVRGNLGFGLKRRGFRKQEIEQRVAETAGILGMSELLDRKPRALSGGQRQRVALGRAIVRDPKVFLFDEPLSNLDAALRLTTRNELIKLYQRLKATIIYVTHDQVEAMTMGTRICIMNDGHVVQIGTPMEVYGAPCNTFVAGFLGSPAMNLIPACITGIKDGGCTVRLGESALEMTFASNFGPGRRVIFGIRPEDIYLPNEVPGDITHATLWARVTTVEPLGAETLITFAVKGLDRDVTARVGRSTKVRPNDAIQVAISVDEVRLFDSDTGTCIETTTDRASEFLTTERDRWHCKTEV